MTEDKEIMKKNIRICKAAMFLLTCFGVYLFSVIHGNETIQVIRNTVMCGMGALILLYLLEFTHNKDSFDYDNGRHVFRFPILYLICLMFTIAFSFLPYAGWPFLLIFILLSLFSNTLTGIYSSSLLLITAVLISGAGTEVFILYFTCGIAASCLFKGMDDTYKAGIPVFLSVLLLITAQTANLILFANESLHFNLFIIPLLNVIISIVLLFIGLKLFYTKVIYQYRDKYLEINDSECALLVQLKDKSKEEYYHAIHTAYFCDRIAHALSLDADALKTGGLYHKIGTLCGENSWERVYDITKDYHFPPLANDILSEYIHNDAPIKRKETAVLIFSDTIVASISYLISRKKENLDYDQIIDTIFKKKLESGFFQECNIQLDEITKMKNIFKGEKLYYDFLR